MPDEVVQTPFGKFLVNDRDLIESTLKAGTLWDGPGFLQPIAIEHGRLGEVGTTILDVGANVGSFSIWLASRGAWRVLAIEAVPETYQRMLANLDLNRDVTADCVLPIPAAAYSEDMRLGLRQPYDVASRGTSAVVPVEDGPLQGRRLDDFRHLFSQRVSLIKMDIQGCELRALLGLQQTIVFHRPVIVFEWEHDLAPAHGDTFEDVQQFFSRFNYAVHGWPSQPFNYLAMPCTTDSR